MTFTLCATGEKLYDRWDDICNHLGDGHASARKAWQEYLAHRRACPECSKPRRVYDTSIKATDE